MQYKGCVPCLLGLEGPISDELKRLGAGSVSAENGRVYFTGSEVDVARANVCLRVGERKRLLSEFHADVRAGLSEDHQKSYC